MHPLSLTFPESAVEEAFHKFHLEKAYKAEFSRTKLLILSSGVNLARTGFHPHPFFVILQWILTSVVLYGMSQIRRELINGRFKNAPYAIHVGLHLIWTFLCRTLLEWTVPTDAAPLLRSLVIKSGFWIAFTANCAPLLTYHYIPLQFFIVVALFSLSPIDYEKGDVPTDLLSDFWQHSCQWNGHWLSGIDISCPEIPQRDQAFRLHLFLLLSIGWVFPGMFMWISEAKSRQAWHRSIRRDSMPRCGHTDFIPISYSVTLTLVTMSTVWLFLCQCH